MRLTWNDKYTSFDDYENWQPYYQKVCVIKENVASGTYDSMESEELLKILECLSEAMLYETNRKDFTQLETTMRSVKRLLDIVKAKGDNSVGALYIELVFLYVNAALYKSVGKNRQAANEYLHKLDIIEEYFEKIKECNELRKEQVLYLTVWGINTYHQGLIAFSDVGENSLVHGVCNDIVECVKWVMAQIENETGVLEDITRVLLDVAGAYYREGFLDDGEWCYETVLNILDKIYEVSECEFYRAQSIWMKVNFASIKMETAQNTAFVFEYAKEAEELRDSFSIGSIEAAIADGAIGAATMQKSIITQRENNLPKAIVLADEAIELLCKSLEFLKNESDKEVGYKNFVLGTISARMYNVYVSALDCRGIQYYADNEPALALTNFEAALTLLSDDSKFVIDEFTSAVLKAECNQYIGIIYFEHFKENEKAIFHFSTAADIAETVINTDYVGVIRIAVFTSSVAAELYLHLKKKSDALKYATKGLESIAVLKRISPKDDLLGLEQALEKYKKKAERKFFW